MVLFPYHLQYLKSTLLKQPCDRLLAACADRQLLHEGQLTLIGNYNSYMNSCKIGNSYRFGSILIILVCLIVFLIGYDNIENRNPISIIVSVSSIHMMHLKYNLQVYGFEPINFL